MVENIYWFSKVELAYHSWKNSWLVMEYNTIIQSSLDICGGLVSWLPHTQICAHSSPTSSSLCRWVSHPLNIIFVICIWLQMWNPLIWKADYIYCKNCACKWNHTVQTHVVWVPTVPCFANTVVFQYPWGIYKFLL